jgi:hypothetical protein
MLGFKINILAKLSIGILTPIYCLVRLLLIKDKAYRFAVFVCYYHLSPWAYINHAALTRSLEMALLT